MHFERLRSQHDDHESTRTRREPTMSLRYALLGVLDARPMTGYELARFFDASTAWVWSAPHSNIYPTLRRMDADGLLEAETDIKGEKLERTTYSITDDGRRALREWVVSDPGPPTRDPLILRLVFADIVDPEELTKMLAMLVERQTDRIAQWADHAEALRRKDTDLLRERLETRPPEDHDRIAESKARVFDLMIAQAETWIEWATRTAEDLGDSTH
jgi:DNA-binding PadR family transcriptional regulator